jgi:hypothetical protein
MGVDARSCGPFQGVDAAAGFPAKTVGNPVDSKLQCELPKALQQGCCLHELPIACDLGEINQTQSLPCAGFWLLGLVELARFHVPQPAISLQPVCKSKKKVLKTRKGWQLFTCQPLISVVPLDGIELSTFSLRMME